MDRPGALFFGEKRERFWSNFGVTFLSRGPLGYTKYLFVFFNQSFCFFDQILFVF